MARRTIAVRGISHVSLVVSSLARARAFYEGVLGLVPIKQPEGLEHPGQWYFLGRQELHLIEAHDTDINPIQHVAIEVVDLRAAQALLRSKGIHTIGDSHTDRGGLNSIYCYDPDGNRIEICQQVGFAAIQRRT